MTTQGIDTGTSQRNLDFSLARAQGFESCYVKLGGDNVGRYVAPHYSAQVDKARAAKMRVGHYWVPSAARPPAGAADYFVDNLRGWTSADFAVLDNESLDGARSYDDAGVAQWVRQVQARLGIRGKQVKVYLGLADARGHAWPLTLATGCDFIIAAYSYKPFAYDLQGRIPADRNSGHQYSSSAQIGSITIDVNAWRDGAFDYAAAAAPAGSGSTSLPLTTIRKQDKMKLIWAESTGYLMTEDGFTGLPSPQVYNLFYRAINSDQTKSPFNATGTPDTFNRAEVDIMAGQLRLLTLAANTGIPIDVDKLAKTLGLALGATFNPDVEIDPVALAAAFDVAIPKIAAAVNRDAAARLSA